MRAEPVVAIDALESNNAIAEPPMSAVVVEEIDKVTDWPTAAGEFADGAGTGT